MKTIHHHKYTLLLPLLLLLPRRNRIRPRWCSLTQHCARQTFLPPCQRLPVGSHTACPTSTHSWFIPPAGNPIKQSQVHMDDCTSVL
jgi:hypothetical protein